ncbi:MAG: radical SAM protein [Chromatiales bacterium]|nr:radical SAM protein [Chromatiales bacterium]
MSAPAQRNRSTFHVELIKPSHYDDDGYVIQWWRAWIPSNSLGVLHALIGQAAEQRVLGDAVDIELRAYDECHTRIPVARIVRRIRQAGGRGLVCLVGVQTNQFPRAMDLAREFRAAGIDVIVGGFHVSGCLAMLPETPPDLVEAQALGVTLFAGEAEGRIDQVLRDAWERRLPPVYNYLDSAPAMNGQPTPSLPRSLVRRYAGSLSTFDAGRGCPYLCSFCTIINVQGRKSRYRDADDVERLIRANAEVGINRYFITDDNFARNKNWEAIFDRLIQLREREGFDFNFLVQVDTMCHKIEGFVEKAARAGCKKAFIGLENIKPENLVSARKGQNRIGEYRDMLNAWRSHGVVTYCGYILGFPDDTPESILSDLALIKRELPADMLEFFILTPLPGSQDHKNLVLKGEWTDPDMNKYDLEHVASRHPRMSADEWQGIYRRVWDEYYTQEHIETLFRRAAASGVKPKRILSMVFQFYGMMIFENVHPLQGGFLRRKNRRQRRPGFARESVWSFYPRRVREFATTYTRGTLYYLALRRTLRRILAEPGVAGYTDRALQADDQSAVDGLTALETRQREVTAARHAKARLAASRAH